MTKSLDILVAIQHALYAAADKKKMDAIFGRPDLMLELERSSAVIRPNLNRPLPDTLFGVRFEPNPMFPMRTTCSACDGTGEGGDEATYCGSCDGAGAHLTEGIMRNGEQTILMRSALPKKFAPYFPKDIPLPRRPETRSHDIPYPVKG
ncbi:hypothetical protein ACIPPQ_14620 [Sphingopyxis sp. LARHCG72]